MKMNWKVRLTKIKSGDTVKLIKKEDALVMTDGRCYPTGDYNAGDNVIITQIKMVGNIRCIILSGGSCTYNIANFELVKKG